VKLFHFSSKIRALLATCFKLVSCLVHSLTLKMDTACSSETSPDCQQTTWCYIAEDGTLHNHHFEKIKSYIHYHVYNIPSLVPTLSHVNPLRRTDPISLRSILILSSHVRLGVPSGLFPSGFPTKILYAFRFSPIRATCPTDLTLLDLIVLFYLAKSTSYEAPHYAVFSNLLQFHPSPPECVHCCY
jgi:hypothetical protein